MRKDSEVYVEANRRAIVVSSAFIPVIRMAILAGFMATLLVGGWMTFEGALLVSSYSLLVFLTQRLLWPLTNLAETVDLYERAMASSRRILDLIEDRLHAVGCRARRDEHADDVGLAGHQGPRGLIRPVAELLDDVEHALPRLGPEVRGVV